MAETQFPRGGGAGLDPYEHKKIRKEAYENAKKELDREDSAGRRAPKHKRKTAEMDDDEALFERLANTDNLPKVAMTLSAKKLGVGAKVWAAIVEVSPRGLVLSMPHGLTGHVPAKLLQKMGLADGEAILAAFQIGQLVRAVVTEIRGLETSDPVVSQARIAEEAADEKKKGRKAEDETSKSAGGRSRARISLSIDPAEVNAGLEPEALVKGLTLPVAVASVEDHGAVVSTGVKGVAAFLPTKAFPEGLSGARPSPGQVFEVIVSGVRAGGRVVVDARTASVAGAVVAEWPGVGLGTVQAGMLVGATVVSALADGLVLSFLTFFHGTVDALHLGTRKARATGKPAHAPGQRVVARVLYVDPTSKLTLLSLHKGLVAGRLPDSFPAMGQIFEAAEVRRVLPRGSGLLCALPSASGEVAYPPAVVPAAQAGAKGAALEEAFKIGDAVRGRVIGFRPMDGLAVLSLRKSVLEQSVLSIADLAVAAPVRGVVTEVGDAGLVLQIGERLRALVPTLHATDAGTRRALGRYKKGQAVDGLVLELDAPRRRLLVTLKASILRSRLPRLARPEDAAPGARAHGVVTGVSDRGLFVTFFGGLAGRVPRKECGLGVGQEAPADAYTIGQVVKARILGADRQGRGLRLSLASDAKKSVVNEGDNDINVGKAATNHFTTQQLQPGTFVFGRVRRVIRDEASGAVSAAFVELREAEDAASRGAGRGRIDVAHLADHPAARAALAECLREGLDLGRLLVLRAQRPRDAGGSASAASSVKDSDDEAEEQEESAATDGKTQQASPPSTTPTTPTRPQQCTYVLTRKPALMRAAERGALPATVEEARPGAVLPAYVVSVTADAAYVRLLGTLTARCPLTLRVRVLAADVEKGRLAVALAGPLVSSKSEAAEKGAAASDKKKKKDTAAAKETPVVTPEPLDTPADLLADYFTDIALAASWSEEPTDIDWAAALPIGGLVPATVGEARDYGTLCDLAAHEDIVGIAAPEQVDAASGAEGQNILAAVLDRNPAEGVVDVSLLPRLGARPEGKGTGASADGKKKGKKRKSVGTEETNGQGEQEGDTTTTTPVYSASDIVPGALLEGRVELVKEEGRYCVVSVPVQGAGYQIGFLAASDYNRVGAALAADEDGQSEATVSLPAVGATVAARVARLADGPTGRLILVPAPARRADGKRAAGGGPGRGRADPGHGGRRPRWRRPAPARPVPPAVDAGKVAVGDVLRGFVEESSAAKGVRCSFGAFVAGSCAAALAVDSLEAVDDIERLFVPGARVEATVLSVKRAGGASAPAWLELKLTTKAFPPAVGDAALGRIAAVKGAGVDVDLGACGVWGHVPVTDIHETLVSNALEGLAVGQVVRVRVVGAGDEAGSKKGGNKAERQKKAGDKAEHQENAAPVAGRPLALSLRPKSGGRCAAHAAASPPDEAARAALKGADAAALPTAVLARGGKPAVGQLVAGYVRGAGGAGVFVTLSRSLVGRLQLRALTRAGELRGNRVSGEAVGRAFPQGALVFARVTQVGADGRVELSQRAPRGRPRPTRAWRPSSGWRRATRSGPRWTRSRALACCSGSTRACAAWPACPSWPTASCAPRASSSRRGSACGRASSPPSPPRSASSWGSSDPTLRASWPRTTCRPSRTSTWTKNC
ncbi:hypothetical protein QBZ16_001205 [Prototheca wickerhamii]|uniref:S1 motif domain-containing protein n=1 Tax=Prototheca wickerhamii TaxID=3111 RepID=A0AAD9IF03_PROWI|nr:hypothetical protein QBZ16_001205 [Prototheca wickerhamii]